MRPLAAGSPPGAGEGRTCHEELTSDRNEPMRAVWRSPAERRLLPGLRPVLLLVGVLGPARRPARDLAGVLSGRSGTRRAAGLGERPGARTLTRIEGHSMTEVARASSRRRARECELPGGPRAGCNGTERNRVGSDFQRRSAVPMNESKQGGPSRRCGAVGSPDGPVLFRVWAPAARRVDLVLIDGDSRREVAMQPEPGGYHRHEEADVPEGRRYAYRLDGGPERPDPCSLLQPEGVHGPSAVVRPGRFAWNDRDWRGVRREDLVFYELHVGTFSPEGTFDGAISRLRDLRELGVTAVEIMPVAQFPGTRNWGYDGVLPYAAQDSYGGPDGLHRLVDACHAEGLAAFLDVVYNHLGPEGSYIREFGPYFNDHYKTPWGSAVNYDDRGWTRCATTCWTTSRMWLEEFHLDGLRLDAVHAIYDLGARHILQAIEEVAEDVAARRGWPATIVAESDLNDPRLLEPRDRGGHALGAQWADDFHHAGHVGAHRRARRVLLGFRRAGAPGPGPGIPVRLRLGLQPVPRPQARRCPGRPGRGPLRRLPAEPRPGGQPGAGRPAVNAARLAGPAEAGGGPAAAFALLAAAVHGRGVRRGEPVPLLLLVRGPGAGPGGARGAEDASSRPSPGRARSPTRRARRHSPRRS